MVFNLLIPFLILFLADFADKADLFLLTFKTTKSTESARVFNLTHNVKTDLFLL